MKFEVAIPSYRRPHLLATHTLPMLTRGGVTPDRITVFLNPADPDFLLYQGLIEGAGVRWQEAGAGLAGARNAITDHYEEGTPLLQCDDDLRSIHRLQGDKLVTLSAVDSVFGHVFERAAAERVTLWGPSPVSNPYFMRPEWKTGLWFCIGSLWGTFNVKAHRITNSAKEDYERTLQHYETGGGVLRARDICFKGSPIRTTKGGMQAEYDDAHARREAEWAAMASLRARWPHLVRPKASRDGYPELELRVPSRSKQAGTRV